MDNGCGMCNEAYRQILSKASSGYSVRNVHRRIQLYYGSECGLTFRSTKGMGTYAALWIGRMARE